MPHGPHVKVCVGARACVRPRECARSTSAVDHQDAAWWPRKLKACWRHFSSIICVVLGLNAMQEDMVPAASAKWITVLVLILEDLPQLVLNCIYIDTMGSNGADGISVFSVMMTVFGEFCSLSFGTCRANPRLACAVLYLAT